MQTHVVDIAGDFAAAGLAVSLGCIEAEVAVAPSDAMLGQLLDDECRRLIDALAEERPQDLPAVAATRAAFKALGKDPARYRPAAEALLRRAAQGKGLYRVNNVVDVNNLISLRTGFSIGTYDAARMASPLVFRRSGSGEVYEGIGRGPLNLEGLPVFADRAGPFGSPVSDSARTMVAASTTAISMILIGFAPVPVGEEHLVMARDLLSAHCAARGIASRIVRNGAEP